MLKMLLRVIIIGQLLFRGTKEGVFSSVHHILFFSVIDREVSESDTTRQLVSY